MRLLWMLILLLILLVILLLLLLGDSVPRILLVPGRTSRLLTLLTPSRRAGRHAGSCPLLGGVVSRLDRSV